MAAAYNPSKACCSTPAVIGPPYSAKGSFVEQDGIRVCELQLRVQAYRQKLISFADKTGSRDAKKALFIIYDVFGYSSQILQGADFLASQGYKVFMPDFFDGKPAPMSWMPMPDELGREPPADEKALDDFTEGPGNTEKTVARVLDLRDKFQAAHPEIEIWGLVGYCWGGYVANFLLETTSPFMACAELHPGFPEKEVAERIARPIIALCSKDEPHSVYEHFKPHVKSEVQYVHFSGMLHGWMSARADLYKAEVQRDFQRGYEMLADFFQKHL